MNRIKTLLALSLGAALSVAGAQSLSAAQSMYNQGKWQEAAAAAAALKTSDGYALAAQALTNGAGLVPDSQKKALFTKAEAFARQAIAADKNNANAYFELARVQGRLAQFSGILQSLGLAKEMKKNLDTAIRLDSKMSSAYIALGLWHANLDSKGAIARSATGASRAQVAPNFEKAIALDPTGVFPRFEYANALIVMKDIAGAKAQLQKAVTMTPTDFWSKRDQEVAKATLAQLK